MSFVLQIGDLKKNILLRFCSFLNNIQFLKIYISLLGQLDLLISMWHMNL